jgi:hypothetical protein
MILYRGGACECRRVYFTENRGLLLTIGPCPYGHDNGYWNYNNEKKKKGINRIKKKKRNTRRDLRVHSTYSCACTYTPMWVQHRNVWVVRKRSIEISLIKIRVRQTRPLVLCNATLLLLLLLLLYFFFFFPPGRSPSASFFPYSPYGTRYLCSRRLAKFVKRQPPATASRTLRAIY